MKNKKYLKTPEDFLDNERYHDVNRLAVLAEYLMRLWTRDVSGKERLLKRPQLIIANHRSIVDIVLMYLFAYKQLGHNFRFVAKKELLQSNMGYVFQYIDTLFLNRENVRQAFALIEEQKNAIQKGKTVIVFPEGTRNKSDDFLEFKSGALEPAYKAMCPIQPIIFAHTELYSKISKNFILKNKKMKMKILEPIRPNEFITIDRVSFTSNLQKTMQNEYNQLIALPKTKKIIR